MKYNIIMMFKKSLFTTILFLILSASVFSIKMDEIPELRKYWDAQLNEFQNTFIHQCVGNEDNTLYLMNTTTEEGWHSVVWAFQPGLFNSEIRFRPLWDKSDLSSGSIKTLVFSPFSKKFYFFANWASYDTPEKGTEGLYAAVQTHKKYDTPVQLQHHQMDSGNGILLVNKKGVWLLHDTPDFQLQKPWQYSSLYQVEDEIGNFILQIPKTVENIRFNPFSVFDNRRYLHEKNVNHYEYEKNFQSTDYALLIADSDLTSWWVYNCTNGKIKKYENYDTAKAQALKIDANYQNNVFHILAHEKALQIIMQLISAICFVFSIIIVVLIILRKNRQKKQSEKELIEHNKMIFDIQEKERAKISRDIHDSVVQDIRVLRLETENLLVDEASKQRQSKIADIATDCIVKLRNICYNLAPAELASHTEGDSSKLELISIINSLVQQFSARTHIPCIFKVDEGFEYPALEKEKTQNLFRVIQECLTNIEKHSYATQTSIFMKRNGNTLSIYVTDDGIGCNPNELEKCINSKEHLGLRSMKDRMELIGGSIEFFTAQNDGMEIKLEMPLENE